MATSREIRVSAVGDREIGRDDFYLVEVELPDPGPGEVQIQNLCMSVDPYMKQCLAPGSRLVPDSVRFFPDAPLPAAAVGRVVQSRDPQFAPGDLVLSMLGWRERCNARADSLQTIEPEGLPPHAFLGPLGSTGLTAFVGARFAAIKPGETVFVSAAAGSVGSLVCQIARMRGARVVGSAGGPEKAAFLKEIGVDCTIDYRAVQDLSAALRDAAPDGLDVYFDNVGGAHLAAAVECARPFARVILCGVIGDTGGVRPDLGLAIPRHIRFQGFSARYYLHEAPVIRREMIGWIEAGHIRWRETVEHGLEAAPAALFRLLRGENIGKMVVDLT